MFLITLNLNSFILSTLSVTGRYMFSNVYFICIEYKLQLYKKRVTYSNIYHKVVTKSADAKIKIGVIKNHDMDWLVQMLTWLQKSFKSDHCHKNHTRVSCKSDYSMSNASIEHLTSG